MSVDETTLSEVLVKKYDVYEKLVCEGTFIRLCGVDREAVGLVTLGLTTTSLIIARPDLSGDRKDYDLLNMFPLDIVTVTVLNYKDQTVSVRSDYKPLQIYKLCSSEDQSEVWDKVSRYLDKLKMKSLINEHKSEDNILRDSVTHKSTSFEEENNTPQGNPAKKADCITTQPITGTTPYPSAIDHLPVEIETFNKQFSMRTFDNPAWLPKFSQHHSKSETDRLNTGPFWSGITYSTDSLIGEETDPEDVASRWSSLMATARDIFCCYW